MKRVLFGGMLLAFLVAAVASFASATNVTSFTLEGVNYSYNTADVSFAYQYDPMENLGQVDVSITNTGMYDPIVTGFVFNAPAQISELLSFVGPEGMEAVLEWEGIKTPEQYGTFDVGVLSGCNLSGGDPKYGILQGNTHSYTFRFNGTDLGALDVYSFLNEFSFATNLSEEAVSFLARIQQAGSCGEFSDVMVQDPGKPVPEPATMVLLGMGLAGLSTIGAKRRK